jgi:VWFA-related protein
MVRAAFFSVLSVWAMAAQQPAPTFRADVHEVRIDAQVVDGRKVITGLTAADFEVFDEDAPQPLTRFGRDTDTVSLVILIDVSGSMRRYARQMAATATAALSFLKEGDEVSVILFAKETDEISGFTTRFNETARDIEVGVSEAALPVGTAIYNALLTAAGSLKSQAAKSPASRRSILILTDNASLNYQINDEQVLEALFAADAVVNAIVTEDAKKPRARRSGEYRNPDFTPTDIFKIAEQTGGEAYRADRADKAFPVLMERLRSRYSLVYRAPDAPPGQFRKVRVELSAAARKRYSGAQVKARSGYYTAAQ